MIYPVSQVYLQHFLITLFSWLLQRYTLLESQIKLIGINAVMQRREEREKRTRKRTKRKKEKVEKEGKL